MDFKCVITAFELVLLSLAYNNLSQVSSAYFCVQTGLYQLSAMVVLETVLESLVQHTVFGFYKQFFTMASTSLLSPGHHTECFARSLHFVMPWCPLWIAISICACKGLGITILLFLINRPSCMDSSDDTGM